jgi:hypothetical protein
VLYALVIATFLISIYRAGWNCYLRGYPTLARELARLRTFLYRPGRVEPFRYLRGAATPHLPVCFTYALDTLSCDFAG